MGQRQQATCSNTSVVQPIGVVLAVGGHGALFRTAYYEVNNEVDTNKGRSGFQVKSKTWTYFLSCLQIKCVSHLTELLGAGEGVTRAAVPSCLLQNSYSFCSTESSQFP